MKKQVVTPLFIGIGLLVGIIFSLQFRAKPIGSGSFPLERLEIQKELLTEYSVEQQELKQRIEEADEKLQEARALIERQTSPQTLNELDRLRAAAGFTAVEGSGIRVKLSDNPGVSRRGFSSVNENFVQASDVRDLVNSLFLKDARAVSINGNRVMPLTSIQPVADNLLVGNFFEIAPFVIEAVGDPDALEEAVETIRSRKIRVFADVVDSLKLEPVESRRTLKFLKLHE